MIFPGLEEDLAPGVKGYTMEVNGALYVPLVVATNPGNGDVGRYLDSLLQDRTVKFPNVISAKLRDMLIRRGFRLTKEYAEEFEEDVLVWVRP